MTGCYTGCEECIYATKGQLDGNESEQRWISKIVGVGYMYITWST